MFLVETARSIAAHFILGLAYIHSQNLCYGGTTVTTHVVGVWHSHLQISIRGTRYFSAQILATYPLGIFANTITAYLGKVPLTRVDGKDVRPHSPQHAICSMGMTMSADNLVDSIIKISYFGISFPELYKPAFSLPPETSSTSYLATLVTDVQTLGERQLFEVFGSDRILIKRKLLAPWGSRLRGGGTLGRGTAPSSRLTGLWVDRP